MKVTKKHLFMGVVLLFSLFFIFQVFAQNNDNGQTDKYLVKTIVLPDGRIIEGRILPSPPTPPEGFERISVTLPEPNPAAGVNVLPNVPAFNWSFGCTATSAAMMAGYYDRTGYSNMYTGPTNGGVMPMDNSSWPDWVDVHGDTRHQCPLSATHLSLDGRTTKGHVDDYWIYYGQPGPDPWVGNWPEHTYGDCTGDYMKTNQWVNPGGGYNTDGSTVIFTYTDGAPLPASDIETFGIDIYDGPYGLKLFYESRGFTVTNMYNQYIVGQGSNPSLGFTYAQYCAEIDAGRPVMIHLAGHTVVGVGYDDASNLVYLHDTWDYSTYTMTWGGSYSGMQHRSVSIVSLEPMSGLKDDLVGTYTSQGVYYRNSDTGAWMKMASPASQITAGDLDDDGTDDLMGQWPGQGGVWIKWSSTGSWSYIGSTADWIGAGDMNGDGQCDLLGTWPSQGVFYRNSDTGTWVKMASPATQITAGDIDGDGTDDLLGIWPGQGGVWVKYSSTGSWEQLSSTADWIACGKMRSGGGSSADTSFHTLSSPKGGFAQGPDLMNYTNLSSQGPQGLDFFPQIQGNLIPQRMGLEMNRIPGPGEPGFKCAKQNNLDPKEKLEKKRR